MQNYLGTAFLALGCLDGELRVAVTSPVYGRGIFLIAFGDDLHLAGHHEGTVEPEAEMADDPGFLPGVFVFVKEFLGPGEGHFIDVFFDLFLGHPDTLVQDMQFLALFVNAHLDQGVAQLYLGFAYGSEVFQLQGGVCGIGDQFP